MAYWNVNVPVEQHTAECPSFLKHVDDWDRAQLGTKDAEYGLMGWEEVGEIVSQ